MTKQELVVKLAAQMDVPKAQVRRMVDGLVDVVTDTLKSGEKVQISGLGTFSVRRRAAREGRNPQTGEKITIPARNAVGFKAAKPLKESVM